MKIQKKNWGGGSGQGGGSGWGCQGGWEWRIEAFVKIPKKKEKKFFFFFGGGGGRSGARGGGGGVSGWGVRVDVNGEVKFL